jgi:hypothetical protein
LFLVVAFLAAVATFDDFLISPVFFTLSYPHRQLQF